jgi:hypothetical protein
MPRLYDNNGNNGNNGNDGNNGNNDNNNNNICHPLLQFPDCQH